MVRNAYCEEALPLTGKWGIGFDSIAGASPRPDLVPGLGQSLGLNAPNAASIRYWLSEKFAWEGDLAFSANSQPGAAGSSSTIFGWGLGSVMKYNFARPHSHLAAQFLGGVSFAQLAQKSDGGGAAGAPPVNETTSTFSVFVGTGFEAFLPFWNALSVEGSLGLRVSTSQTKSEGQAQASSSNSSLALGGSGFSPLNVAIHYYF